MKALLIGINTKYIHPSISLYQLKANTDYQVDICEFIIKDKNDHIIDKISDILNSDNYNLIGFSCYLWNIEKVLNISKIIKQNFPIKVLLGGPEVSYTSKDYFTKYSHLDYIIRGEGEVAFNELMMALDNKIDISKVSNLSYLKDNIYTENTNIIIDLSKIKLATLMTKDLDNQVVYLESSRGCPYHCAYCTASLDNNLRFFPLENVLNILLELMKRKAKIVKFLDRTFNANKEYMISILKFINENNICTTFQFEIVIDRLSDDVIEFINKLDHKFLRFEIGIQTTNNSVNKNVDRYQNMDKVKHNITLLNNTKNIDLHVDLIAGLPGETKEMFIKSFNETFYLRCKELQLGFLKFLKGTKLMSLINEYGYEYTEKSPYEVIRNSTMSTTDLDEIKKVEKGLNYYYNSYRFINTFNYLFDNNLIDNPYYFFLRLSDDINNLQLYNLFIHIDNIFKEIYINEYQNLHYELIKDYLLNHLVKPKRWWDTLSKEERNKIFPILIDKINGINIHDLYEYSIVINNHNKYFIIVYKNYNPVYYEVEIEKDDF